MDIVLKYYCVSIAEFVISKLCKRRFIYLCLLLFGATPSLSQEMALVVDTLKLDSALTSEQQLKKFSRDIRNFAVLSTISWSHVDAHRSWPDHMGKRNYLLNAKIVQPFVVVEGADFGLKEFRFTIHAEPFFHVRILRNDTSQNDTSSPVRTPSYMPGASVYIQGFGREVLGFVLGFRDYSKGFDQTKRDSLFESIGEWWRRKVNASEIEYRGNYLKLRLFHHSNGQNLNTVIDTTGNINAGTSPPGYVNRFNGDFGININFEIGLGFWKADTTDFFGSRKRSKRMLYFGYYEPIWGAGVTDFIDRLHPSERLVFRLTRIYYGDDFVKRRVGKKRAVIGAVKDVEDFRWELYLSYTTDFNWWNGPIQDEFWVPLDHARRVNMSSTFHWRLPFASGTTVFGEIGWYGSDPYNTYYQRSILTARFGLGFGFLDYPVDGSIAKSY